MRMQVASNCSRGSQGPGRGAAAGIGRVHSFNRCSGSSVRPVFQHLDRGISGVLRLLRKSVRVRARVTAPASRGLATYVPLQERSLA